MEQEKIVENNITEEPIISNEAVVENPIKKPLLFLIVNICFVLIRKAFVILYYFEYIKGQTHRELQTWQYFVDETSFISPNYKLISCEKGIPLFFNGRFLAIIAIISIFVFLIIPLIKKNYNDSKFKLFVILTITHLLLTVWFIWTFYFVRGIW